MSADELNQRIKEEVVLREGDLFEWQWRQMGLVDEAAALGLSPGDFMTLVNEVSRAINPYFGRISDLKVKVADLARLQRKKLTTTQTDGIVAEAVRLQLPPDFTRDRWLPAILATIPEPTDTLEEPVVRPEPIPSPIPPADPVNATLPPVTPDEPPVSAPPVRPVSAPAPVRPPAIDRDAVTRKVHQFLDEYVKDKHIPVRVLKPLFLATNFDESILADAVLAYLSANFYAAETPVQGDSLHDKLLSSDWRHLSWWATALPDPVPPAVARPDRPSPRSSSDSSVIGMALVVVGVLVGGAWWITKDKTADRAKATVTTALPRDTVPATARKKSQRKRSARTSKGAKNQP